MNRVIAITLGDVTGIGPEVTLKALEAELREDETRYVIYGDGPLLERWSGKLGIRLDLGHGPESPSARVRVAQALSGPLPPDLPNGAEAAARAALAWLTAAAEAALRSEVHAVVTAPVNKAAIIRTGASFTGQTEFLSRLAGAEAGTTGMMLLGHDDQERWLRVMLATTHLPLRRVPDELTVDRVRDAIDLAAIACAELDLASARIGVCGLNPHAGEQGALGDEEQRVIEPAVRAAQGRRLNVTGPVPADTIFHQALRGSYDVVVAMYHDQGLAPLKMLAFDNGVNWTVNLPFIRTSPDHGTAYDLVGTGRASPASMIAAIRLAKRLVGRREERRVGGPRRSPEPP